MNSQMRRKKSKKTTFLMGHRLCWKETTWREENKLEKEKMKIRGVFFLSQAILSVQNEWVDIINIWRW